MTSVSSLSNSQTAGTSTTNLTNTLSGTKATTADTDLAGALQGNSSSSTSSTSGTTVDDASKALKDISDKIAALGSLNPAGNVQEYEKTTQDVLYDNNATGRSIGQLRLNTTRLNVISALSPKDAADVFTFTASTPGQTKLSFLVNDPSNSDPTADGSANVRIQVFAKGKGLVADSNPDSGAAYKAYQALKGGTYDIAHGDYTVRVSRADGVDPQKKGSFNYAMQLSQGNTFKQDFSVTEQAYTAGTDDPFGLATNSNDPLSILSGSLSDAYSFISSLPAIGTTGTSKLLGFIYSSKT